MFIYLRSVYFDTVNFQQQVNLEDHTVTELKDVDDYLHVWVSFVYSSVNFTFIRSCCFRSVQSVGILSSWLFTVNQSSISDRAFLL